MNYAKKNSETLEARLMGVLASLLFSIPTCVLLWLMINVELISFDTVIGLQGVLILIGAFAMLAFVLPNLFPSLLGRLWRAMLYFIRVW
ncbi:MAG: hypothetical protein AB1810_00500 [Pseudomonadota bacterium]